MSKNMNLKWIAIQPLTGGMYLGAEEAIGYPAEMILSFDGLNKIWANKKGQLKTTNEYHLTTYLKKAGRMVPYYIFKDRKQFIEDYSTDIKFVDEQGMDVDVKFEDIDFVCAVPVCSGLSSANSTGTSEQKESRNCNMKWITKYTLEVIRPKMFVFENAPALYSDKGTSVREWMNKMAEKYNYSITYYKTDTQLHYNCQRRPRTFVMFIKNIGENSGNPIYNYENEHIHVEDFFNSIPEDALQQVNMETPWMPHTILKFMQHKFGNEWRDYALKCKGNGIETILRMNLADEMSEFLKGLDEFTDEQKARVERSIRHVVYKVSIGMGYMCDSPLIYPHDYTPSVIFKTIPHMMHPVVDRFITIREALALMGMPHDFELQGQPEQNYAQIGQNVPVKTAKFIASECVRIINEWNDIERSQPRVQYVNNIKQKVERTK